MSVADQAARQIAFGVHHQLDAVLDHLGAEDLHDLVEHVDQVERRRLQLELLGLGKIEDMVDQRQKAARGGLDHRQVLPLLLRELGLEREGRGVEDGVHRRADLVAHGGEERALGAVGGLGGLANLAQLLLLPLARGDVGDDGDAADEAPALAADGGSGHVAPALLAVLAQEEALPAPGVHLARDQLADLLGGTRAVVGVGVADQRLAEQVLALDAEELQRRVVDFDEAALVVVGHDADAAVLEERLEELVAQAQRLGSLAALGDVEEAAGEEGRRPALVEDDLAVVVDPALAAVFVEDAVLERPGFVARGRRLDRRAQRGRIVGMRERLLAEKARRRPAGERLDGGADEVQLPPLVEREAVHRAGQAVDEGPHQRVGVEVQAALAGTGTGFEGSAVTGTSGVAPRNTSWRISTTRLTIWPMRSL